MHQQPHSYGYVTLVALIASFKSATLPPYGYCTGVLIQEATAASRFAVAMQLAVLILNGELVVVGQLFTPVDLPQSEDDNVLATVHVDDARIAVWLA